MLLLSQIGATFTSLLLNSFLIWLIVNKSPKKLGRYRYLMIYTATFDIYYALLGTVSNAAIFSHGYAVLVYRFYNGNSWFDRVFSIPLTIAYCGSFGMSMACLAIHFVYRYGVTISDSPKKITSGWRFTMLFVAPGIYMLWWGSVAFFGCAPDQDSDDYLRYHFLETLDLRMENVTYVLLKFYKIDQKTGLTVFNTSAWIVAANMYVMVSTSEYCVLYLGLKCYSNISKQFAMTSGTSKFSASLQKQLFNALVIQTIVPVLIMYMPIFVFFLCPILNIDMGYSSRFISDCIAWYPAVNPFPNFIVIRNYRNAIIDIFTCHKRPDPTKTQSQNVI